MHLELRNVFLTILKVPCRPPVMIVSTMKELCCGDLRDASCGFICLCIYVCTYVHMLLVPPVVMITEL